MINAFALFFGAAFPIIAFVVRVGEIQSAGWSNPDIIRAVEELAFKLFDDDGDFASGVDAPEFVLFVRTGPQVAPVIERKTIRASTRPHEGGEFALDTPFQD